MKTAPLLLLCACADLPSPEQSKDIDFGDRPGGEEGDGADGAADSGAVLDCPWQGGAWAGELEEPFLEGEDALGTTGDLVLANPQAAWVIQSPEHARTYYHYGGLPIDGAAMSGCSQAAPERFEELGLLPGRLNALDFATSTLHQFNGQRYEILSDGSDGGPAHLRVSGVDDRFWLIEYTLLRELYLSGSDQGMTETLYLDMTVDYYLEPDSPALKVVATVTNRSAEPNPVVLGAALWPSDHQRTRYPSSGTLSVGGFGLRTGLPWWATAGEQGSVALAWETDTLAQTNVSGVEALLDLAQLGTWSLSPAGEEGDSRSLTFWLSVGATDFASALAPLEGRLDSFAGEVPLWTDISGQVLGGGAPLPGARVELQRLSEAGVGQWWAEMVADEEGRYSGRLPLIEGADFALVASAEGRQDSAPVPIPAADHGGAASLDLELGEASSLVLTVSDAWGLPTPARASVYDDSGRVALGWVSPAGLLELPLAPGSYTLVLSRGYVAEPWIGLIELSEGERLEVVASLGPGPDTSGWLSFDGHVHSTPSADSSVLWEDRFGSAAGDGLDIIVHTDHEILTDPRPFLAESQWAGSVVSVTGEELTATVPEHLNIYSVPIDAEAGPRGDPIRWYGKDLATLYAEMAEQGAGVRTLNHPKNGCSWMCLIGWDTVQAEPTLEDPTLLGLAEDAELWSWDFDAIELLNGNKYIFLDPSRPADTGLFDDWINFWLHGHFITAVGVSDVHDLDAPGANRNWIATGSEDLAAFEDSWLVDAVLGARSQISAGAFALASIDGAGPGEMVHAVDGGVRLAARVEAIPSIDVTQAVVFVGCEAVAELWASAPDEVVKLDEEIELAISGDTVVVLVAFGEQDFPAGIYAAPSWVPRALTNPIRVDGDGDGVWTPPGGEVCEYHGLIPSPP